MDYSHISIRERYLVKGAIRRVFRQSESFRSILKEARVELPPALKKNGTPGKKNQVRYRCANCKELFSQKHVQIDHILTVVPLDRPESEIPFNEWIALIARGIFCKKENLQVLCSTPVKLLPKGRSSCHRIKTNEENYTRDEIQAFKCGHRAMLEKEFKDKTIEEMIEFFRLSYAQYLVYKEEERLAVEQRKLDRLNKKKTKI